MITLIHTATVTDGILKMQSPRMYAMELKQFEGMAVTVTIKRKKRTRSTFQNNYYWGAVIPIVRQGLRDSGVVFNSKQTHDLLKYRFLKQDVPTNDGEAVERIQSTTELSTTEFMAFIAQIQQWAAEFLNTQIPDPNEQIEI